MKTLLKTIGLFIVLISFFNCSSDDDSGQQQEEETNFMSAKIDNEDFFTDFPIYFSPTNDEVAITGQNEENKKNIQIAIFNYNGPDTYTINNSSTESSIILIENGTIWITDQDNGSETVTFTEEGNYLKGTFVFTALNSNQETINITEGKFKVQIHF